MPYVAPRSGFHRLLKCAAIRGAMAVLWIRLCVSHTVRLLRAYGTGLIQPLMRWMRNWRTSLSRFEIFGEIHDSESRLRSILHVPAVLIRRPKGQVYREGHVWCGANRGLPVPPRSHGGSGLRQAPGGDTLEG